MDMIYTYQNFMNIAAKIISWQVFQLLPKMYFAATTFDKQSRANSVQLVIVGGNGE